MFDAEELRRMSPQERLWLRQELAELDAPELTARKLTERRRTLLVAVVIVCCVVLAAWIGVLASTLPRSYRTGAWRGAWVGFDLGLLIAFVATGWAAWRRRQILIICLVVLATLLCCDAWFDVMLDARTSGFVFALLSAALVELPLAAVAILSARRLLRVTNAVTQRHRGESGPVPRLRDMPLAGTGPGRPLSDLLTVPERHLPGRAASASRPAGSDPA